METQPANPTGHGHRQGSGPDADGESRTEGALQDAGPSSGTPTSHLSSRAWTGVGVALVCLVVVVVFVLQNLDSVRVSFFGAHWRAPLAVDLLLAAVLGGLIVFGFGSVRIIQLRRAARRRHPEEHRRLGFAWLRRPGS